MKKIHDRKRQIAILLLSFLLIVTGMPVTVFADAEDAAETAGEAGRNREPSPVAVEEEGVVEAGALDEGKGDENEELFAEYVDRLFIGDAPAAQDITGKRKASRISKGSLLEGRDKYVYDYLAEQAAMVAAGTRTSTIFEIPVTEFASGRFTAADLGVDAVLIQTGSGYAISPDAKAAMNEKISFDLDTVIMSLMADCPYELYWFDKTSGYAKQYPVMTASTNGTIWFKEDGVITIYMAVAPEYAGESYDVVDISGSEMIVSADASLTSAATTAAENAHKIVDQNKSLSDYAKVTAYKEKICDLTSYNYSAANNGADYGNPWQLIWVFDNDSTTKVVCEGYAKAFQYLCDMSDFRDERVSCISVSGMMTGGSGAGRHMWNILTMNDGINYLVDVTNSDAGTIGNPDYLFLKGYRSAEAVVRTEDVAGVATDYNTTLYTYRANSSSITYYYNYDTEEFFSDDELTVSAANYVEPPQHEHTPLDAVIENSVDATCEESGSYDSVVYCADCGEEISRETVTVPALGHEWSEPAYEWEADNSAVTAYRVCSHDEKHYEKEKAEAVKAVVKESTCTETGAVTYTADFENPAFETQTRTEETAALGHDYTAAVTKPTCTDQGYTTYTCSICGDSYKDNYTDALGHTAEVIPAVAPTCTETGLTEGSKCSVCGEILTAQETVPALGHDWGEWTVVKEATEDEEGLEQRVCGRDSGHTEERTLPKLPHTHNMKKTEAAAATCTEAGNIAYWTCSKCGGYFSDEEGLNEISLEETVVPAIGHDWSEWTVTKKADCTEKGEETRTCRHDAEHKETREITALGHDYEAAVTAPTCTEQGFTTYTCTRCGDTYKDDYTEALGHTAVSIPAVAPTCTERGLTEGSKCSVCGEILTAQETIPALGHDWGEWTVTKEADCTEKGEETRTCKHDAEHKETREIAALGHTWGSWEITKEPTATEPGIKACNCKTCGSSIDIEIPALGEETAAAYEEIAGAENAAASAQTAAAALSETSTAEEIAEAESAASEAEEKSNAAYEDAAAALEKLQADNADEEAILYAQIKAEEALEIKINALNAAASIRSISARAAFAEATEKMVLAETASRTPGTAAVTAAKAAETAANEAYAKAKAANDTAAAAFAAVKTTGADESSEVYKAAQTALEESAAALAEAETAAASAAQFSKDVQAAADEAARKAATPKVVLNKKLPVVKILTPKAAKKAFTAKWKKLSKANQKKVAGIEIQIATNKSFTKGVKTYTAKKTAVKKVIKKLKSKKTYYVRIRTYKKVGKIKYVSKWSTKKKTIIK